MRRRLTTLMCADVVGYSALMGRDEALAVASVQELRHTFLEPVAAAHGGEVLKRMGDGWILAFPKVEDALDCAEEVQASLAEHDVIKLRIGCHIGEIVEDDTDFYGNGVNIAQRIETEAPPGGAMFSEDLFRALSESRQKELSDAGMFNLKNIATPIRLYQWRPANLTTAPTRGALPSIAFEKFAAAPSTDDIVALADDLHDGMVEHSLRRTGITTVDGADDAFSQTVFLVRGRLRVSGNRARFALSLLMREDMSTLWSESYEGDTTDPFAFVDKILEQAEGDLRLQTIQHDGQRLSHLSNNQLSVSELRARAANQFFKQTFEGFQNGLDALDRAVALSPRDGMSLAMRSQSRINIWGLQFEEIDPSVVRSAGEDLNIAVAEAPNSDFVFWARGAYRLRMQRDVEGAKRDAARSRQISPHFLGIVELIAHIALFEGRYDDAITALSTYLKSASSDPFKISRLCFLARIYLAAGRFEDALQPAREAADLRPTDRGMHLLKALVCAKAGDLGGLRDARAAAAALPKTASVSLGYMALPDGMEWINDATHPQADPA